MKAKSKDESVGKLREEKGIIYEYLKGSLDAKVEPYVPESLIEQQKQMVILQQRSKLTFIVAGVLLLLLVVTLA